MGFWGICTLKSERQRNKLLQAAGALSPAPKCASLPKVGKPKSPTRSKASSASLNGARPTLKTKVSFMQKLPPIFKAIEDVRTALGEKFTSADLEVNVVRSAAKFESLWMEDAYGDGRQAGSKKAKEEMVVGTTGIGLKKIVIDREKELPVKGRELFENIVAPKVVLESTLRESLDPPPPTSRGKIRRKKVEQEAPPAGGIGEGNNN